jgi:hypothetical protein
VNEVQVVDKLSRSHAVLSSLSQILTDNLRGGFVSERYVLEYHGALDQLEEAGYDLLEFRIASSDLKRRFVYGNTMTGEKQYSDNREVEHALLLMKVRGVLNYFTLSRQPSERRIGFSGPSKN